MLRRSIAVYTVASSSSRAFLEGVRRWIGGAKQFILKNPNFLLVLLLSFVEVFLNLGRTLLGDSNRYVNFALFFLGRRPSLGGAWYTEIVVMRPMVPLLSCPLILILGDANLSFGLVSGFFWVGGVIVAYKLGLILLEDRDLAILMALLYAFAPPLLLYGAGVMTDSAGFFFIGLAVYFTLVRKQQSDVSSRIYFIEALIISVGVLFRESVLFALVFMITIRFVKRKGFFASLLAAGLVGVVEILFLFALGFGPDIFVYKYLLATEVHTPATDWGIVPYLLSLEGAYVTNGVPSRPYFISLMFWIWALPILLSGFFALIGLMTGTRRKDLLLCLLFLFPSSVIWPAMRARFSFSTWPVVLPSMIGGAYFVFSKLLPSKKAIASNPKICIFLFVFCLGVINTVDTLIRYPSLTTGLF